jgi:hypothetical protein
VPGAFVLDPDLQRNQREAWKAVVDSDLDLR